MINLMLFALLLLILNVEVLFCQNVTITIPGGQIKGKIEVTRTKYGYYTFSGVRYGQPPVGNLRFKSPLPSESWNGTYDATYEKNVCFPTDGDLSLADEDCLFLNIYTRKLEGSLPVMAYIHGGGFISLNSGRGGYGPEFFMEHDVVLVSIEYRLGLFGFASTNDMVIPGNAGLKDQTLALKWIQQNIQYFGGDPAKVTIFGESAGSASSSYHLLSSNSAGLFRAAILESGSALSAWAYQRDQRDYTFKTASYIDPNFKSNSSNDLLTFLLNATAQDLFLASKELINSETPDRMQVQQGFYYAPVIEPNHEGAFLTKSMFEMFQDGKFNNVPVIIGINAEEGLITYTSDFNKYVNAFNNNGSLLIPRNMHIDEDDPNKATIIKAIEDFYGISKNRTYEEQVPGTLRYFTDQCFARSIIKQAQLQSNFGLVYFYVFSYDGEMGDYPTTVAGTGNVTHGEELFYLFVRNLTNSQQKSNVDIDLFPESDRTTHHRLIKLWINFAVTLNPTPQPEALFQNITWPLVDYSIGEMTYLDINTNLTVKTNPRWEAYTLWNDLYEKYAVKPLDGY